MPPLRSSEAAVKLLNHRIHENTVEKYRRAGGYTPHSTCIRGPSWFPPPPLSLTDSLTHSTLFSGYFLFYFLRRRRTSRMFLSAFVMFTRMKRETKSNLISADLLRSCLSLVWLMRWEATYSVENAGLRLCQMHLTFSYSFFIQSAIIIQRRKRILVLKSILY